MEITIKKTSITKPPRMIIYGPHGIGKSSMAAKAPNPIFIPVEDGLESLGVDAFDQPETLEQVHAYLDYLIKSEHKYKSVAIDSLDWLEKLIFKDVCLRQGVEEIGDIPFGRGYQAAEGQLLEILKKTNRLNKEKKMYVIFTAHAKLTKFEDPENENYDKYQIDLQKACAALASEYVDVIAFCNWKVVTKAKKGAFDKDVVKAKATGERIMYLEDRPAFNAKNRYGLPPSMPMDFEALIKAIKASGKKDHDLTPVVEDKIEKKLSKTTEAKTAEA